MQKEEREVTTGTFFHIRMGPWDKGIRIDLQNKLRFLFITFLSIAEQSGLMHLGKLSNLLQRNAQSSERQ